MIKSLENLDNKIKPIPFWSWNDDLDKDVLVHQIKEMKKQGIGGFFMHARSGLKTEYLSEKWYECVKASLEESEKSGMNAWLYDEEGWPSGFAGGKVTALSKDYYAKTLRYKEYKKTLDIDVENILSTFIYNKNDKTYKRLINEDYSAKENETIIAIYIYMNEFYIDVAYKEAVDKFIEETHDKYYERFSKYFGTVLKGFFTDEPRFITSGEGDMPFSFELEKEFLKRYNYDIKEHLVALFFDTEDSFKVRYDFFETISDMFVKNFTQNIYNWCSSHDCCLTGHIMMEESLYSQMSSTGGVMPHYQYMHIPGVDWLRRMISYPNTPKQVGSVAAQMGTKQVLTESFALCGWDVSFEELKWILEWQYVNGVNLLCQHLESYTIRGLRKRDYPPSLFLQQTWWDKYYLFNDYVSKLGAILAKGEEKVASLLIHPINSAWCAYDGHRNDLMISLDKSLENISSLLSEEHISYHYGDEKVIKNCGKIEDGKFVVGKCEYDYVLLPMVISLDKNTVDLLLEFIENRGKVYALDNLPTFTNGDTEKLEKLNSLIIKKDISKLRDEINSISIEDENGQVPDISFKYSSLYDYDILFMVNHSRDKAYKTKIRLEDKFTSVSKIYIEENKEETLVFDKESNSFDLFFEKMGSHVILLNKQKDEIAEKPVDLEVVSLKNEWNIDKCDLNSMTLDYCEYSIDNSTYYEKTPVIHIMDTLLNLKRECDIALKFDFFVDYDFNLSNNKEFYVVIEDADTFDIFVNDKIVIYENIGTWKDASFLKVDIKPYVINGKNEIVLKKKFYQSKKVYDVLFGENVYETELNKLTYDTELESIYLLGDFSVYSNCEFLGKDKNAFVAKNDFVIKQMQSTFKSNCFTKEGLLFFAQSVTVSQDINITLESEKDYILDLSKPFSPLVEVYVNDIFVKDILWAPYNANITKYIVNGKNKITLKLYASNRNLLGPHHHVKGEIYNVGPMSFTGKWSWVERESEADVNAFMNTEENFWSDDYSFVKFGLKDENDKLK